MSQNRVLIGLPLRLDKAKKEIARFERREQAIRDVLARRPDNALDEIERILNDDPGLDQERA